MVAKYEYGDKSFVRYIKSGKRVRKLKGYVDSRCMITYVRKHPIFYPTFTMSSHPLFKTIDTPYVDKHYNKIIKQFPGVFTEVLFYPYLSFLVKHMSNHIEQVRITDATIDVKLSTMYDFVSYSLNERNLAFLGQKGLISVKNRSNCVKSGQIS
jgi:hypothetical protein